MVFKTIERDQNWCDQDILDNMLLSNNETLMVQFPDRKTRKVKIVVKKWNVPESDMGVPTYIPHSKAYVETKVYGVKVTVPLAGLKAKRV